MAIEDTADNRIKLAIGTQFVEIQAMQDQLAVLRGQLVERDRTIVAMGSELAALQVTPGRKPSSERSGGNDDE